MSDRKALLEVQRNKNIKDIVLEALNLHRGTKSSIQRASLELGISDATLYNWCRALEIPLSEYRQEEQS